MKNKYLVLNPFGTVLIKCTNKKEAKSFITWHYNQAKDSYKTLTGWDIKESQYQVLDYSAILSYDQYIKDFKPLTPTK